MPCNTSGGSGASDDVDAHGPGSLSGEQHPDSVGDSGGTPAPFEWPASIDALARWAEKPADEAIHKPPAELMSTFRVASVQARSNSQAAARQRKWARTRGWNTGRRRGKLVVVGAVPLIAVPSIAIAAPAEVLPVPLRVVVEQVREVTKAVLLPVLQPVLQPLLPDGPARFPQPTTGPGSQPTTAPTSAPAAPMTDAPDGSDVESRGATGPGSSDASPVVTADPTIPAPATSSETSVKPGKPFLKPSPPGNPTNKPTSKPSTTKKVPAATVPATKATKVKLPVTKPKATKSNPGEPQGLAPVGDPAEADPDVTDSMEPLP